MTGRFVIFFLVVLIVVGVIVYFATSGLLGNGANFVSSLLGHSTTTVSFGSSTIAAPSPTYYLGPPNGSGDNSGNVGSGASSPSSIPAYEIPAGFTASQLSPYFHQVRFGGISSGFGSYAGQISLSSYPTGQYQNQTIDVTGWQIKANRGGEFIPQAVNVYDPSGLASPSDIRLKSGDQLVLYSTSGPFNLRLNECIGYVSASNHFNPQLPLSCPQIDRGSIQGLTGACQNYLLSVGQCQVPTTNNPAVSPYDYSCQNYIENNFGYKSCFDQHESEANFLSNQVWVWMGSSVTDPSHDQVELLDKNGLLVDFYSY